jgi:2-succinyl-5-enolpyruvyl-6-hydroxy-3-cyclohexene-1-carboxylate synthase
LTVHIGEISGDYYSLNMIGKEVWRVSEDGEIRDTFKRLRYVFEMDEMTFFKHYTSTSRLSPSSILEGYQTQLKEIRENLPEIPFSNIWLASVSSRMIPKQAVLHFGILNSLRSWNFFELDKEVQTMSNVGGFGIDGGLSTLVGASLASPDKLCFIIIGDLAFFYDMNSIGNRHVGTNLRILVVNNGKGTEFRQYSHVASAFGDRADEFVSASGHFGNKSRALIKNYVESLGFKYLSASCKEEYLKCHKEFFSGNGYPQSMVFEVFTDSEAESRALELVRGTKQSAKASAKHAAKKILGERSVSRLRKIMKK